MAVLHCVLHFKGFIQIRTQLWLCCLQASVRQLCFDCWISETLWCFNESKWMLPSIFPVCITTCFMLQMKAGSSTVLKQEYCPIYLPNPCALFHVSVFTFHTCIFCERKKLNKSWQFDFPFLKLIFSLLLFWAFKSLVEVGNWSSSPSSTSLPPFRV